ncbi:MAG: 2OG-Fe dioxygenase family protein [Planctomycetota bacterium]
MSSAFHESPVHLDLVEKLRSEGFVFLSSAASRAVLVGSGRPQAAADPLPGWEAFSASWDDLGVDSHMADEGRYRRRRHGLLRVGGAGTHVPPERLPDAPHYQELEHNRLNGGKDRSFEPLKDATFRSGAFQIFVDYGRSLFSSLMSEAREWLVEAHQFRIEARVGAPGQPTPEGVHRDGVDFVLVALVRRVNIESGTTTIHDESGAQLGEFTLTEPLDMALLDDRRVWHGVTAVDPMDETAPAWRDVLVLTFRARPETAS